MDSAATPILHLATLAVVQGVTEFLPISSSAHLILVPVLTGWSDQGLALDVALHVGTLLAVVVYFRADVAALCRGCVDLLRRQRGAEARLAAQVFVATLPVVVVGLLLKDRIETDWRSPTVIMATTAAFGIALWIADSRAGQSQKGVSALSWLDVVLIGLAQALALVPGVSRSGITMTAALLLGQTRSEAARFSLLLSIPTTAAAGSLAAVDLALAGDAALRVDALIGGGLAFLSALLAVAGLMRWLRQASFLPFVVYRLGLSVILAIMIGFGLLDGM